MRRFAKLCVLTAACLFHASLSAQALDPQRLAAIDAHALAAPASAERSIDQLAKYLAQPARNDAEKARAIFRWISDRISYDVDAFLGKGAPRTDADDVLQLRTSICDGYSSLFERLGKSAGLEVVSIKGYAKGYLSDAVIAGPPNHAWNAIRIDGKWHLVDPTWGAGYINNGKYRKSLTDAYFMARPESLMISHYPVESKWQLQSTRTLSRSEFDKIPPLDSSFFQLGIPGEDVWKTFSSPSFKGMFVRTYEIPYLMAKVEKAPLSFLLEPGREIEFEIRSSAFEKIAIVQGDKWHEFRAGGNLFSASWTPTEKGDLFVMAKKADSENFTAILGYRVD